MASVQNRYLARVLSSPPALRSELARSLALSQEKTYSYLCAASFATPLRASSKHPRVIRAPCISTPACRYESTTTTTIPPIPAASEQQQQQTTSRKTLRYLANTALLLLTFTAGFAMSAAPAAETVNGYVNPPSDAQTLDLYVPETPSAEAINTHILTHPLAVQLRAQQNIVESRPHMKIPVAMRPHNLTGGTLLGEDKIAVPPLNFSSREQELPTLVQIVYLGEALCGHPGIVHGGLLATLLDEGLARACFPALPNKVGVTASLKIDYRSPCPANSYVVLKAETTKVEGRKAWVKGWIELLGEEGEGEGTKLVEADALFIEPRGAKQMARVYSSQ